MSEHRKDSRAREGNTRIRRDWMRSTNLKRSARGLLLADRARLGLQEQCRLPSQLDALTSQR